MMIKDSKFISKDNKLFKGHISLFKHHDPLSINSYSNKKLKSLYRANMSYHDYPKYIVLIYIFDSIINYRKKFNYYWLTLENIYKYRKDFEYLDQILKHFKIKPTVYFSETLWLLDHGQYPYNYDRHLGCPLPDINNFDLVIKKISHDHKIVIKDTLVSLPIIDGWQQVYLDNALSVSSTYNQLVNQLNLRAISSKDLKLVDQVNSYDQLTLDDKRYLIYTIYCQSDSCYLQGNFQYWSGMIDHHNLELEIIGKALGYWINFDNLTVKRVN